MKLFILAQIIGIVGIGCYILSYQIKSNHWLYIIQTIGCSMFCIQYWMLDAITGCVSLIILICRNCLLMRYHEWKWVQWKGWVVIFSALAVGNMILTWQGPAGILTCVGLIAGNIGMWTDNARNIRIANAFIVAPTYMIYDVIIQSYAGIFNEAFTIASVLVSIKRFGWKSLGVNWHDTTKIKNVVFDIGNVLAGFPWHEYCHKLFNNPVTEAAVTRSAFECEYWKEFDRGEMDYEEIVGHMLEVEPDYEAEIKEALARLEECVTRQDYAIPWIDDLKSRGYKVYYLSNYSDYVMSKSLHAMDFLTHMDGGIFSWKVRAIKPDEQIYRCLFEEYHLNPEECVFIDDSPRNIDAARELGMKGIVFENYEQAHAELEVLL